MKSGVILPTTHVPREGVAALPIFLRATEAGREVRH
jgi:hypothetical protein